jgi:lysophospholipase L1-like esterase
MRKAITTTAFVIGYVITNGFLPTPADSRARLLPLGTSDASVDEIALEEGEVEIPEIGPESVVEAEPTIASSVRIEVAKEDPEPAETPEIPVEAVQPESTPTAAPESLVQEPTQRAISNSAPESPKDSEPQVKALTEKQPVKRAEPESVPEVVTSSEDAFYPAKLRRFFKSLRDLEAGRRKKVHVVHYGDSEIAGDGVTRTLRQIWGRRFGVGGPGFTLAARPFPTYHRDGYRHRKPLGFLTIPYTRKSADDTAFGPGGVLFETWGKGAQATVDLTDSPTSGGCDVGFYYIGRSGGGTLDLSDGKESFGTVNTSKGSRGVRRFEKHFNHCPNRLRVISTRAGRTQIYGWTVSYDQPGILWSSMGVLSAQLSYLRRYQDGNFGASLRALAPKPDLVVLAYGLNIGSWSSIPGGKYKSRISSSVSMVRREAGNVDCLMMGPYPIGRFKNGRVVTSPAALAANRIQSKVAAEQGCSYLDRIQLAGGPSATQRWLKQKPKRLSSDYVHMTFAGSRAMAADISQVLLRSYDGRPTVSKSAVPSSTE